jgi:hypothetical protein
MFIFPKPACYKCFTIPHETKKTHTCKILLASIIYVHWNDYHTGQKSYSTPSEASQVFPPDLLFFDRKTSRGTRNEILKYYVIFYIQILIDQCEISVLIQLSKNSIFEGNIS